MSMCCYADCWIHSCVKSCFSSYPHFLPPLCTTVLINIGSHSFLTLSCHFDGVLDAPLYTKPLKICLAWIYGNFFSKVLSLLLSSDPLPCFLSWFTLALQTWPLILLLTPQSEATQNQVLIPAQGLVLMNLISLFSSFSLSSRKKKKEDEKYKKK